MKEYYTYAYLRKDGTPYYIGKGKGKRINFSYNRRAKLPPKERRIFLKKNITEEEAIKHEIYMIALFGRKDLGTGILRNLTNGGDGISGCKRSKELKEKIAYWAETLFYFGAMAFGFSILIGGLYAIYTVIKALFN